MMDLVMRINSVEKSSKSELSSRGKRPFKVFSFSLFFGHRWYESKKPCLIRILLLLELLLLLLLLLLP